MNLDIHNMVIEFFHAMSSTNPRFSTSWRHKSTINGYINTSLHHPCLKAGHACEYVLYFTHDSYVVEWFKDVPDEESICFILYLSLEILTIFFGTLRLLQTP